MLPDLTNLNLQGNPATLLSSLTSRAQGLLRYDLSSLYSMDFSTTCFQANIKNSSLQVLVDPSFFAYSNCQCRPGYYGKPPNCQPCMGTLTNAQCSFTSEDKASTFTRDPAAAWNSSGNIIAADGYYATPSFTYEEMMINVGYPIYIQPCRGGGTDETPCMSSSERPCEEGYTGRLCSACAKSYFLAGEACYECPTGGLLVAFGVVIFLLVALLFAWSLFISLEASGMVKVLMLFLQGLFFIHVPMPKALNFVESTGESAFITSLAGPECFVSEWSFDRTYAVSVLTPWIALLIVMGIWAVGRVVQQIRWQSVLQKKKWTDRCRRSAIFFLLFSYMGTTKTILTPLACEKDPGDSQSYMISLPYHKCSSSLTAVSVVLFVLYVIGLPALLTWMVIRSDVLKKGAGTRRNFVLALLFESYHPRARFWELVVSARRVIFALAFAAVAERSAIQSFLVMAVLGCTLVLQDTVRPFHETSENVLEMVEVANLAINYVISIKTQAVGITDSGAVGILLFVINISFVVVSILVMVSPKFRHLFNRLRGRSVADHGDHGGHEHGREHREHREHDREAPFGDQELAQSFIPPERAHH